MVHLNNFESILNSKYIPIMNCDNQGKRLFDLTGNLTINLELLCYVCVLGVSLSEVCTGASQMFSLILSHLSMLERWE